MLECGHVIYLTNASFEAGVSIDKIFVVFAANATHLMLGRTTSRSHPVRTPMGKIGCQADLDFHYFAKGPLIMDGDAGPLAFQKDTWILFDDLWVMPCDPVVDSLTSENGSRILGRLYQEHFSALVNCAIKSQSLSGGKIKALKVAKEKGYEIKAPVKAVASRPARR